MLPNERLCACSPRCTHAASPQLLMAWDVLHLQAFQLRDHALRNLSEGITIADPNQPDTPIVYVNDAFCRITGYSRDDVIGKNCRFLQGPETDAGAIERLHLAIQEVRSAAQRVSLTTRPRCGAGQWQWLLRRLEGLSGGGSLRLQLGLGPAGVARGASIESGLADGGRQTDSPTEGRALKRRAALQCGPSGPGGHRGAAQLPEKRREVLESAQHDARARLRRCVHATFSWLEYAGAAAARAVLDGVGGARRVASPNSPLVIGADVQLLPVQRTWLVSSQFVRMSSRPELSWGHWGWALIT
jgi:PAS domain S-box-containing protein